MYMSVHKFFFYMYVYITVHCSSVFVSALPVKSACIRTGNQEREVRHFMTVMYVYMCVRTGRHKAALRLHCSSLLFNVGRHYGVDQSAAIYVWYGGVSIICEEWNARYENPAYLWGRYEHLSAKKEDGITSTFLGFLVQTAGFELEKHLHMDTWLSRYGAGCEACLGLVGNVFAVSSSAVH